MRAAIVRDGIVENIIIAGKDFVPPLGAELVPVGDAAVTIGAAWDGVAFINPEGELPEHEITMRDKLVAAGFTEAQADAILAMG